MNGDGRVDVLQAQAGTRTTWLNDGDTNEASNPSPWVLDTNWQLPAGLDFVNAEGQDLGLRFVDIDGDAMVDIVLSRAGTNDVYLNQGSPPDLLKVVTTQLGGTTEIEYEPSTRFDNTGADGLPDLPQIVHVVSALTVDDDRGNRHTTTFDYSGGLYDAEEREFRGFSRVVAIEPSLRQRVTIYAQDDARVGLPLSQSVWKPNAVGQNQLWQRVKTSYTASAVVPYVTLREFSTIEEGDAASSNPRTFRSKLEYDAYGNVTKQIEYGEVDDVTFADLDLLDTRVTLNEYTEPNPGVYLVDRVQQRSVWQGAVGNGLPLRRTEFLYDNLPDTLPTPQQPTLGEVTKQRAILGVADKADPTTIFEYDQYGNLEKVTDPRASDPNDPGGATTILEYDATYHTFQSAVENALVQRTELDYAPQPDCAVGHPAGAGLAQYVQGPNDLAAGEASLRCYDAFGRIVLNRAPADLAETVWTYSDQPHGRWVSTEVRAAPSGHTRNEITLLDGFGRPYQEDLEGPQSRTIVTSSTFDSAGRVKTQTSPYYLGETPRTQSFEYDPLDRIVKVTLSGVGRVYKVDYDGEWITFTQPSANAGLTANVTKHKRDAFGRTIEVHEVNPVDQTYVTSYAYRVTGELETVTDHAQHTTSIFYDALGRRDSISEPDTGTTVFDYDANGNLTLQSGPAGDISWTYDDLSRVFDQIEDGVVVKRWRYDTAMRGVGRLAGMTSSANAHQVLEYDLQGQVVRERVSQRSKTFRFTNSYDPLGQLLTRTYPNNRVVSWERDLDGFLTGIATAGGSEEYAGGFDFEADGRLRSWTSGGGVATSYQYDSYTGRLEGFTVGAGNLEDLAYDYWDNDQIREIINQNDSDLKRTFTYDALNRLVEANGPFGGGAARTRQSLYYGYDATGNLGCKASTQAVAEGCLGTVLTYDPAYAHRLLTVDGAAVDHDDAGNVETIGGRTYTHNREGRLLSIQDGTVSAQFRYDVTGRLAEIQDAGGQLPTGYLLAEDFEWRPGEQLARIHVHAAGLRIATHEETWSGPPPPIGCAVVAPGAPFEDGSALELLVPALAAWAALWMWAWALRVPRGRRMRVAVSLGAGGAFVVVTVAPPGLRALVADAEAVSAMPVVYYHQDHLGSSVLVTDDLGQEIPTARTLYRPFGEPQPSGITGEEVPEFGFTGQRQLVPLAVYHYRARWYDPELGRFLEPDALVPDPFNPQNLNRYSYVLNDPVNLVDPSGNEQCMDGFSSTGNLCSSDFANNGGFENGVLTGVPNLDFGDPYDDGRLSSPFGRSLGGFKTSPATRSPPQIPAETQQVIDLFQGKGHLAEGIQQRLGASSQSGATAGQTTVELLYTSAAGAFGAKHAFVLATGPEGQQFGARAGPASRIEGPGSPRSSSGNGVFGTLAAEAGPFDATFTDFGGEVLARQTVFVTDQSFGDVSAGLSQFAADVNAAQIPYNPLSTNSNAFAHQAPTVIGGPRAPPIVWAPGSGTVLRLGGGRP